VHGTTSVLGGEFLGLQHCLPLCGGLGNHDLFFSICENSPAGPRLIGTIDVIRKGCR
jgi:hypothetical protein